MTRGSKLLSVFLVMTLVVTTAFSTGTQMSTATMAKAASGSKKKSKVLSKHMI